MPDLNMAYAATFVVVLYVASVAFRWANARWYEWLMAALGVVAMLWFWIAEWRRQARKKGRGGPR